MLVVLLGESFIWPLTGHTNCVAHCHLDERTDLKPANVMINSRGEAKISDFGLAREHENTTVMTGEAPCLHSMSGHTRDVMQHGERMGVKG